MLNSLSEGKLGPETPLCDFESIGNSIQPDMWRIWSIRRAGSSNSDFEGLIAFLIFLLRNSNHVIIIVWMK